MEKNSDTYIKKELKMVGLIIGIILFNYIAFKTNRRLTTNQIVHIFFFTIAFQACFDIIVDFKYHAYWYFSKEVVEWSELLPHLFVVPPVNIIFLNWFPFNSKMTIQIFYFTIFVIVILGYELLTLLPEPWGYYNYGAWRFWYSAILNPVLLLILIVFYKWICKLEIEKNEV